MTHTHTKTLTLSRQQAETFLAVALERVVHEAATPLHRTLAERMERAAFLIKHARDHVARDAGNREPGTGAERRAREYIRAEIELRPFLKA